MPFVEAPRLPEFIARQLPLARRAYRLERGADAGRVLHLIDEGPRDGPVVWLQHGNPTWSFLWRAVIARLPAVRCIAPDLLGLGFSDRLARAEHTIERHGAALAELAGALGIDRAVLVAQDWGGPLLLEAARQRPGFAAGLLLANTAVVLPRHSRGSTFHRVARLPGIGPLLFVLGGFPQNVLHRVQADRGSMRGDVARAYRWPLRHWRDRAAPLALARLVPVGDQHPSLAPMRRIEEWVRAFVGPFTLVWGERDPILGRALARHERALPRARVVRTAAGHFLQEEVPEVLAAEIRGLAQAV